MNIIHISGYIGQVKPIRTAGSSKVLRFSLATNRRWKDSHGEEQQRTTWFHCAIWGRRAEGLARVLAKGQLVEVYGAHESREYSDNDGQTRTAWEVNVEGLAFLGKKENGGSRAAGSSAPPQGDDIPEPDSFEVPMDGSDDIPF